MTKNKLKFSAVLTLCAWLAVSYMAVSPIQADAESKKGKYHKVVKTKTADGVTIFGETYFGDLPKDAPLVLMFHQGGASGRGEYHGLAPWLNSNGFRVIAWDQRSGGKRFDGKNRTVAHLKEGVANGYCDAYPDLQAALNFTVKKGLAKEVVVWGSSYSGALVVQLAAKNKEVVSGVAAFSPASGGPLKRCLARDWIDQVKAPVLVMRPESEMARDTSKQQKKILSDAGVKFKVVADGIHGSSMLVDERTGKDMSKARNGVLKWLKHLTHQS